jgi:hypothetical protein
MVKSIYQRFSQAIYQFYNPLYIESSQYEQVARYLLL